MQRIDSHLSPAEGIATPVRRIGVYLRRRPPCSLAAAGVDVLSEEPPPADHPLLLAPNALITPHIAWATRAARQRLLDETAANVAAFLAGQPRNVVPV